MVIVIVSVSVRGDWRLRLRNISLRVRGANRCGPRQDVRTRRAVRRRSAPSARNLKGPQFELHHVHARGREFGGQRRGVGGQRGDGGALDCVEWRGEGGDDAGREEEEARAEGPEWGQEQLGCCCCGEDAGV